MRILYVFGILSFTLNTSLIRAQEMKPEKLKELLEQVADTSLINGNSVQILYHEMPIFCIYDENANHMRIITPIIETKDIVEKQLLNMLVANFLSAFDVKYVLSDETIWSIFTHPLKELTDHQRIEAISQVHAASITFGVTYSSTNLVFPGNTAKKESPRRNKLIERINPI